MIVLAGKTIARLALAIVTLLVGCDRFTIPTIPTPLLVNNLTSKAYSTRILSTPINSASSSLIRPASRKQPSHSPSMQRSPFWVMTM